MPECYFSHGKNGVLVHAATWMDLGSVMGSKKPNTKGHVLYDPIHMKGPDWEIYGNKSTWVVAGTRARQNGVYLLIVGFPLGGMKMFVAR